MYTALWLEDDFSDIPCFIQNVCDALNVNILFASSIFTARDIVREQHIDLFLLDIEIADERMTGIEYALQLRSSQEHYQTPIVFVSNYSHLARHLFTTIQNCQLLTKPYTQLDFKNAIGFALGIYDFTNKSNASALLLIPIKRERTIEIDARTVCYIEFLKENVVRIQFNDSDCITLNCQRSVRKYILEQIEQNDVSHLVQIYRSIIVNVNEIKSVKIDGREGDVYLFGDEVPKPLGGRYRDNLKNFL